VPSCVRRVYNARAQVYIFTNDETDDFGLFERAERRRCSSTVNESDRTKRSRFHRAADMNVAYASPLPRRLGRNARNVFAVVDNTIGHFAPAFIRTDERIRSNRVYKRRAQRLDRWFLNVNIIAYRHWRRRFERRSPALPWTVHNTVARTRSADVSPCNSANVLLTRLMFGLTPPADPDTSRKFRPLFTIRNNFIAAVVGTTKSNGILLVSAGAVFVLRNNTRPRNFYTPAVFRGKTRPVVYLVTTARAR